ncbi:MAG: hypothetical protein O9284_10885 [Steroidobacteraceae bacterium]|jgi:hypothetical protein|nr:hypothetical protein [Steroidobacteraceae bacterium]
MNRTVLQRLRHRRRGFAAAALALFLANWLSLALAPCAMAFAATLPAATVEAPCEHCPDAADPALRCHDDEARTRVSPSVCEMVPKPAIDFREAKVLGEPLWLALAAPVLLRLEPAAAARRADFGSAVPIPDLAPVDRYGRRLE